MTVSSDRLLRRTLWANAGFSILSGIVLVACAGSIAKAAAHGPVAVAGLDLVVLTELLGVGVVIFGAICAWVASRERLPRGWAQAIFTGDVIWVVGSAAILALPATWTTAGIAGIVVLAVIVADLAILEYLGLRRLERNA